MVPKEEIQRFIRNEVEKEFFDELEILIPQTFQDALKGSQQLKHTPQEQLRGQLRHVLVQDGMGAMKRWSPVTLQTNPKGSYYVLLAIGNLRITAVVLPSQKEIRPAKYRTQLKTLNESLAAQQIDWINEHAQPGTGELMHALIVVHAPPPHFSTQSEPLCIMLAVPYFNGKGFHMNCTLQELVEGYPDKDAIGHKDLAWPKLRDKMRRAEEMDDQIDDDQIS